MTNSARPFQKIIWAVDPLEEDKNQWAHSISLLKQLSLKFNIPVQPVHVLSEGLLGLSSPSSILNKTSIPWAQSALKKVLDEVAAEFKGNLKPPNIIVSENPSSAAAAEKLDEYAKNEKADLIFVHSHGRSGLKRAFLGSFAETLLTHAKTPILLSGPRTKKSLAFSNVLFATDLSQESHKVFSKFRPIARRLNAKRMILFHALMNTVEPLIQSGVGMLGGGFVMLDSHSADEEKSAAKKLKSWIGKAKSKNQKELKIKPLLSENTKNTMQAILSFAKKNHVGLIAMATQSSPVSAALLGSVARQVGRLAPCPVFFAR